MGEVEEVARAITILAHGARGNVISVSVYKLVRLGLTGRVKYYSWILRNALEGLGCQVHRGNGRVKAIICPRELLSRSQEELVKLLAKGLISNVRRNPIGDVLVNILTTNSNIGFSDFVNHLRSLGLDNIEEARILWAYLRPILECLRILGLIRGYRIIARRVVLHA